MFKTIFGFFLFFSFQILAFQDPALFFDLAETENSLITDFFKIDQENFAFSEVEDFIESILQEFNTRYDQRVELETVINKSTAMINIFISKYDLHNQAHETYLQMQKEPTLENHWRFFFEKFFPEQSNISLSDPKNSPAISKSLVMRFCKVFLNEMINQMPAPAPRMKGLLFLEGSIKYVLFKE